MVTADKIGSWEGRKERLRKRYPYLTDEDFRLESSNRIEMFGNLKARLDKTSEELHEIIISL